MFRLGCFAIAFFSAMTAFAQIAGDDARSWVARNGKSRVVGKFESLSEDHSKVFLVRSDNGKRIQVLVSKLSAIDYLYVCEHIRRAAAGTLDKEQYYIPLVTRMADSSDNRWNLIPAIKIDLPPRTIFWKLIASQPMFFGAFASDDEKFPDLMVYFEMCQDKQDERLKKIQEQNEATSRFLEERGYSDLEGEMLKEDSTLSFQKALVSGKNAAGERLSCETHVRFNHLGTLVFRAFGTPERIQELRPTMNDFIYFESDTAESRGIAVGTSASVSPLASEVSSRVPTAIREDFEKFREQAVALISRANNARQVLETLAEPQGLAKLKANSSRWDSAVVSFDVRKRLRLRTVLQTLDWKTAWFEEEFQRLSFTLPEEIAFVKTDQGWKIIN